MNIPTVERPIGIDSICCEIERICRNAPIYRRCDLLPESFIVQMNPDNGREAVIEYAVEKYKTSMVLDFESGLDDYISLSFDGTLPQFKECERAVKDAAIYQNTYNGIYMIDCIAFASHSCDETQYKEFFDLVSDICNCGCAFFFVPEALSNSEERFVDKLMSAVDNIKRITWLGYTTDDISKIILKFIYDHGVEVVHTGGVESVIRSIIATDRIKTFEAAHSIASAMLYYADFSAPVPTLDEKRVKTFIADKSAPDGIIRRDAI